MTPRVAPRVELRATPAGLVRFNAIADHWLSVHAGAPARVSCHNGALRSVSVRGEICVLPAGSSDECFQDDPSDAVDLHLPRALVRLAAEEMGVDPDRAGLEPQSGLRDRQIEHIAWALEAEHRASSPSGPIYREGLGLALAAHLLTRYRARPAPRPTGGLSTKQLVRVTDYVEAHLGGDLSLLPLARLAGVSASHFRVLFKRAAGVPVHQYVIRRRVERARALIVEGELTMSQIALEAGFSHQSHMARCMRQVLGVTPSHIGRPRG